MRKAVLKKDLGKLKTGTVLHFTNGVFAHKKATFMPEDVYFDETHFEVIEMTAKGIVSESYPEATAGNVFDIFLKPQLAQMVTE